MIIFLIAQKFHIISDVMKYFLEREGYATEMAIDIVDGLKKKHKKKDLILLAKLDPRAKNCSPHIVKKIHELSCETNTTMIGVSNNGDVKYKISTLFKDCGAKYIIKYPFNILGLLEIVQKNYLSRKKRSFKR